MTNIRTYGQKNFVWVIFITYDQFDRSLF